MLNAITLFTSPSLHNAAAGVAVSPLLAEYGAAKAYIAMFSKALNVELKKSNIHVQCQVRILLRLFAFCNMYQFSVHPALCYLLLIGAYFVFIIAIVVAFVYLICAESSHNI